MRPSLIQHTDFDTCDAPSQPQGAFPERPQSTTAADRNVSRSSEAPVDSKARPAHPAVAASSVAGPRAAPASTEMYAAREPCSYAFEFVMSLAPTTESEVPTPNSLASASAALEPVDVEYPEGRWTAPSLWHGMPCGEPRRL